MTEAERLLGLDVETDEYRGPSSLWKQPLSGRLVAVLTIVGAAVVGFLVSAGVTVGRSAAVAQDARKAELIALIELRQERVEALNETLERLRHDIATREAEVTGPTRLHSELRRVEEAAGLTPLRGRGLRVTLSDASSACPGVQPQDCRIQDVDLQLAVNTLLATGAEAIAVNDERLIATTAIRGAGQSILVNYRVLTSPYVIEAIGNPVALERRFADSDLAADFEVWTSRYGLGFKYESSDELVLPAFSGSLRFRSAGLAQ